MMWASNDFLPGLEGVGWKTANKLHKEYESISNESDKVCACSYAYNVYVRVSHSPSLNMRAVRLLDQGVEETKNQTFGVRAGCRG